MHSLRQQSERRVRTLFRALAVASTATLAACAVSPEPPRPPAPRSLGSDHAAYVAPESSGAFADDEPAPESVPEPRGSVRLRDALAMALLHHPDLAASSWDVRAAEARALQAGLPPNPEVEIGAEDFGGNGARAGFGGAEFSIGLSQEILRAGKLEKRAAVARLEGERAAWNYETRRLDVLTETAKAFAEVLAAQERLALVTGSVRVGEEVLRTVGEQVRAGKVPPLDENRARVALALHGLQRDRARRDLDARRRTLAATWGSTSPVFDEVEGALYDLRPFPGPDRFVHLLAQNPDIARWAVEMELHRANVDLQLAEGDPDVTLTAGVKHFEEDDGEAFLAAISFPLPVFDRNAGGIRAARADRSRAREEMRAAAVRVSTAFSAACHALAASGDEAATLRDAVLPAAQSAFAAADEGFRLGEFGYLDVLDAQRTLFDVKLQLVDALAAHHAAVADVERLIGQSLGTIVGTGSVQGPQGDNQR